MKSKEPFKRLTIDEMRKLKESRSEEAKTVSAMMDAFAHQIDQEVDKVVLELLTELGFEVKQGMTAEELALLDKQMKDAGVGINIESETVQVQDAGTTKAVHRVKVWAYQLARTLEFDLGGEGDEN